jgi:hypothetical protein
MMIPSIEPWPAIQYLARRLSRYFLGLYFERRDGFLTLGFSA